MKKHTPSFDYYKQSTDIFGLMWVPTTHVPYRDGHDWILDFNAPQYDLTPEGGGRELHWSHAVDTAFRRALQPHIGAAKAILEIGVFYMPDGQDSSSTLTLLELKNDNTIYVGLDLNEKSLNGSNIHTIVGNSFDQENNRHLFRQLGIEQFDIICIDGDHSINAAFNDWKYVDLLAPGGLVCMHDTNHHPGPFLLMEAIDDELFEVWQGAIESYKWEWGIGFARRRM